MDDREGWGEERANGDEVVVLEEGLWWRAWSARE